MIFPSSAWFESSDPASMFGERRAPSLWVLREQRSFEHLHDRWGASLKRAGVTLALDHDMVVSGREDISRLLRPHQVPMTERSPLVVSRLGAEAQDMTQDHASRDAPAWRRAAVRAYSRIPHETLKIGVRRRVVRKDQQAANERMIAGLPANVRERVSLTRASWYDISDPTLCDWNSFVRALGRSSLVVTNRLHVALPSTILGAETYLVDSGYHKLRGVYERSLGNVENIRLIRKGDCE
ncbi:hypothetical protein [Pedococcus cremeus]|uniref:hypothetical protein n=1 Tax=Pedococcus cremeus TaxID=587636 RepID=UPI00115FB94C|nr:hypothetical protein [Pedococcus cremeus]